MAAYHALQVFHVGYIARSYCLVVDLLHRPVRTRGGSTFVVGSVGLQSLLDFRHSLYEKERAIFDERMPWMGAGGFEDGTCYTLAVLRFYSAEGLLTNMFFPLEVCQIGQWAPLPGWAELLS